MAVLSKTQQTRSNDGDDDFSGVLADQASKTVGRAHLKKCELTCARQIRDGRDRLASLPGGDEIAFVAFKMPQKSAG